MGEDVEQQGQADIAYPPGARRTPHDSQFSWAGGVRLGMRRATDYLLGLQHEDGHWCAEIEGDTILESEYILALHYLGRTDDPRVAKAAGFLRERRLPDGGWALYPGGPADVSSSVKAYFALKLAGDDPDSEPMRRTREEILRRGGLDATNSFTRLYLAIFGQYEWENAPAVPPELILLPTWFPFNIYEMSSWSRAIVVPLSIIWASKPHRPVPASAAIGELLAPASSNRRPAATRGRAGRLWARFFVTVDRSIKLAERLGWTPLRRMALRRAEAWIRARLPRSEGLGAIFPPILNTIIAFDCLGYAQDDPVMAGQIAELGKLELEDETSMRVQPCRSPVWDTCLALNALADTDLERSAPALLAAADWILDREVSEPGDWRVKSPKTPVGGWYFEYANEFYPDTDDTAQVLTALAKLEPAGDAEVRLNEVAHRAWAWLLGMQNRDGGWGSFDRGCDREILTHIPFADHNAMIDPSTTDITGRVLEALARWGYDPQAPAVRRAVDFVRGEQEADGSWYGRWGCNYIYGTYLALWGLEAIGEDTSADWGRRAADWLRTHQNADGGWGELPASYEDPALKGLGPSTACQTAWALLGLFATGDHGSDAVVRGIDFLLERQLDDGGWYDTEWTGTGFPEVFYLKYHYYAIYFPLLALATYLNALEGDRERRPEDN